VGAVGAETTTSTSITTITLSGTPMSRAATGSTHAVGTAPGTTIPSTAAGLPTEIGTPPTDSAAIPEGVAAAWVAQGEWVAPEESVGVVEWVVPEESAESVAPVIAAESVALVELVE
jgi:hypothetical protein